MSSKQKAAYPAKGWSRRLAIAKEGTRWRQHTSKKLFEKLQAQRITGEKLRNAHSQRLLCINQSAPEIIGERFEGKWMKSTELSFFCDSLFGGRFAFGMANADRFSSYIARVCPLPSLTVCLCGNANGTRVQQAKRAKGGNARLNSWYNLDWGTSGEMRTRRHTSLPRYTMCKSATE